MTEWSDAEISRRLALAIGWSGDQEDPDVVIFLEEFGRKVRCAVWFELEWRTFDYRDPAVIWPIAERFDCFPARWNETGAKQWAALGPNDSTECVYADTAAKAVALAIIKAKEQT